MPQTMLIFKITSFGQLWCLSSRRRANQMGRKIGSLIDSFQLFYPIVCKINYLSVTSLFMCKKKKNIRSFFFFLCQTTHHYHRSIKYHLYLSHICHNLSASVFVAILKLRENIPPNKKQFQI